MFQTRFFKYQEQINRVFVVVGRKKVLGSHYHFGKKYFTFGNKLKRINLSEYATEFSLLEFTYLVETLIRHLGEQIDEDCRVSSYLRNVWLKRGYQLQLYHFCFFFYCSEIHTRVRCTQQNRTLLKVLILATAHIQRVRVFCPPKVCFNEKKSLF